jgi:ATP-binding cassette, subfamily B, bacterial
VEVLKDDKRVAVLADGDYFGEIALLRRVSRTATVRTVTPTLLLSLRDTHFQALLKNQPELEPILRRREADSTKP